MKEVILIRSELFILVVFFSFNIIKFVSKVSSFKYWVVYLKCDQRFFTFAGTINVWELHRNWALVLDIQCRKGTTALFVARRLRNKIHGHFVPIVCLSKNVIRQVWNSLHLSIGIANKSIFQLYIILVVQKL